MKKTTKKVAVKPYSASIKILGKIFTSKGGSVREAIENLKVEGKCAGISILTINGKDKILTSVQTTRLFSPSKIMRELALKGVSSLFANL